MCRRQVRPAQSHSPAVRPDAPRCMPKTPHINPRNCAHLLVVLALGEVGLAHGGAVHLRQPLPRLTQAGVAPVPLHLARPRGRGIEHLRGGAASVCALDQELTISGSDISASSGCGGDPTTDTAAVDRLECLCHQQTFFIQVPSGQVRPDFQEDTCVHTWLRLMRWPQQVQ